MTKEKIYVPKRTEKQKWDALKYILECFMKAEENIQYYEEACRKLYALFGAKAKWWEFYKDKMGYKLNIILAYFKYFRARYNIEDEIMYELEDIVRKTM